MKAPRIYFDYNATTPLRDEAKQAISDALDVYGNPSSVHEQGRAAKRIVETARLQVASLIDADPAEVVFTGGGTEANGLAIHGLLHHRGVERVLVSAVEHDSVLGCGAPVELIPVDKDGVLDVSWLRTALANDPRKTLVSVMAANNETGVLQPLSDVAQICRDANAFFHTDAVQVAGRLPLSFRTSGADVMGISGHKFGGPKGVGALFMRDSTPLAARQTGGGQERGRRAGTENLIGIAGFGAAAAAAAEGLPHIAECAKIRDHIEAVLGSTAILYGNAVPRLPTTTTLGMPGVAAETQVMLFDLDGISVSAGSACSSGKVKSSHVLSAMGVAAPDSGEAIRVSLGWNNTMEEAERFIQSWRAIYDRLAKKPAAA